MLVNVTFAPAADVTADFMKWAKEVYMPDVAETDGCDPAMMLRVAAAEPEAAPAYAIQFRASRPSVAIEWLEERFPTLLSKFFATRPPETMPFFPTIMEIIG